MNNTSFQISNEAAPLLLARDVFKSYEQGTIPVLTGISFEAYAGQTVALCGPSGCGKSTLLHLLGGLDEPTSGNVFVNGRELKRGRSMRDLLRYEIGFVFQLHNLLPDLTLEENCMIPAVAKGTPHAAAIERFNYLAERTGLSHRSKQRIQKLSGGERQRTALCRALMNKPAILIADEPTGSLDEKTSAQVFDLLMELVATEGVTLVMATHDRGLAKKCSRQVEMHDGKIVE